MSDILIGGVYQHFKGYLYQVLHIAIDMSDFNKMIVCQSLNTKTIWTIAYQDFTSMVKVDSAELPRFTLIKNE
jgi:hypothetical protein